jgi:hypothetical protein
MLKRGLLRRAAALCSAVAVVQLVALAGSSPASADTMRTLKVALSCDTGMAYGLYVDTGSGFVDPGGSSYASGGIKYFTVSIPASATTLAIDTSYCDNETLDPVWRGYFYSITPGTSTITTNGYCSEQVFQYYGYTYVNRYCSLYPITYS